MPPAHPLILVDTSVWVSFFRTTRVPEVGTLDALLSLASVATCAPIRAEVVSGAPTAREFERLQTLFEALPLLQPPQDVWLRIEEARYALARRGHQASLIDLLIAVTAQANQALLWTLDRDFRLFSPVIPLKHYHPEPVPE